MNSAELSRIQTQLKHFDCNASEAEIYVKCLEMGPSSVQEIARAMRKNRVTVHSSVVQLIDKGLITESRKGKRRLIVAEEPDVLYRLLQKKQSELEVIETNLDYVTKLLYQARSTDTARPTVKFYEGVDGFKKMLEESLDNKSGRVYVFTYVDIFSKVINPDYLENYFVRRAKKKIRTQLIFPPCDFADRVNKKASEYLIEVRLLPPELVWKSGFFSWDNKVALMSYTENKLTTTIIENEDIAYFVQSVMFKLTWQQSSPMS